MQAVVAQARPASRLTATREGRRVRGGTGDTSVPELGVGLQPAGMSWFQRQVAAVALAQFREERLSQRVLIGQRWGQLQQQAAEPGAQLGNFAEKALQFLRAISQALFMELISVA